MCDPSFSYVIYSVHRSLNLRVLQMATERFFREPETMNMFYIPLQPGSSTPDAAVLPR